MSVLKEATASGSSGAPFDAGNHRRSKLTRAAMRKNRLRGLIEVGFIIFLFYSNLLMGEFERSGAGQKQGLLWALADILTLSTFEIGTVAAIIAFVLFEFLRSKF
jgi:hypothetical protein